ncbi:bactofilin family protein [Paenibacillus albiflavus]|nr:polymer-forming cytoskeletal protein [Paenibacillus albiflavus]
MFGLKGKKYYSGGSPDSIIGGHTLCEGKIMSETSIRIEGQIQGEVDCAEDVTIGEGGVAQARIQARDVIIAGKVKGDVSAKGKMIITPTGELVGNAQVRTIIIEDGGIFSGNCTMVTAAETTVPKLVTNNKHELHPASKAEGKLGQVN